MSVLYKTKVGSKIYFAQDYELKRHSNTVNTKFKNY